MCVDLKPLAAIRLDDMILEHRLQPPDFKLTPKSESRIVLRKTFPETWIWANLTTGYFFRINFFPICLLLQCFSFVFFLANLN